ncbi:hypothetical protein FRC12_024434 [Ceratobasidium sp. 428]|nr:hypothetical protein FRC12_024434 [Ceratobasidium sp. 428]
MDRVFKTPELVSMICAHLPPQFMLVSRHFFHGMLPHHWETTKVSSLFTRGLIPADWVRQDKKTEVLLSRPLTPESMSRFHFYAPFIKIIELGFFAASLNLNDWSPLIAYAQTTRLLPNLVQVAYVGPELEPLTVFLNSSVRMINLSSLRVSFVKEVLDHIAIICPEAHQLEFYPSSGHYIDNFSLEDIPSQTFVSLAKFRDLRRLTSGVAILQSHSLQLLAELPYLAFLQVEAGYLHEVKNVQLCRQLPADSFPSLTILNIDLPTSQDVKRFWDLVPLKKLIEVHIFIQSADDSDQMQFIPSLCRGSPLIRALLLDFPRSGDSEPLYRIGADMFEHLRRLPLNHFFSVTYARLDFERPWNTLAMAWPQIQEIRLINQPANLEDFMSLSASLPNLSTIECDFSFAKMANDIERNWEPTENSRFYPGLKRFIIKQPEIKDLAASKSRTLDDLAKFFAYFWPSAQTTISLSIESELGPGPGGWIYEDGLFNLFTRLVKAHVRAFHGV